MPYKKGPLVSWPWKSVKCLELKSYLQECGVINTLVVYFYDDFLISFVPWCYVPEPIRVFFFESFYTICSISEAMLWVLKVDC